MRESSRTVGVGPSRRRARWPAMAKKMPTKPHPSTDNQQQVYSLRSASCSACQLLGQERHVVGH